MSPYVPIHDPPDPLEPPDADDSSYGVKSTRYIRPIQDEDDPCPTCGYNLRGLPVGSKCPECGGVPTDETATQYEPASAQARVKRRPRLVDIILVSGDEDRKRWKVGLTLACLCLIGVIAARMGYFALGIASAPVDMYYLGAGFLVAIAWFVAVVLISPKSIEKHFPKLKALRRAVVVTQFLWIPAYALWLLSNAGVPINAKVLMVGYIGLRAIAGIGFIALGQLMVFLCEEAELDWAARRFNTASWLIAFPSLLGQVFVGPLQWIFIVLFFIVLAWWCWMLSYYVLGFWQMRAHAAWSIRHARDAAGREQRILEKKRELERENEATIRALPVDRGGDHPLVSKR